MKRYVSSSRLDNISNWKEHNSAKSLAEASGRGLSIDQKVAQVRALKPRIQELLETANAAVEAGILIVRPNDYAKPYIDYFETEGLSHPVGFYNMVGGGLAFPKERQDNGYPYEYVGIENGGANGPYDFITDGKFVGGIGNIHDNRDRSLVEDYPEFDKNLDKFLQNFNRFESGFYKYIDDLTGGAN